MANVLILGCGDVGVALASRLTQRGHAVCGVRRHVDQLPPFIQPIATDLNQLVADHFPAPMDYAVFCAAASNGELDTYRSTYVTGLQAAIKALECHPLRRILFTSSTRVYGINDGSWVDEHSATTHADAHGKILCDAERILGAAPCETVRVRFGGIYGPGRLRMLRLAQEGSTHSTSDLAYTNRIHRDDCAGILDFLIHHRTAPTCIVACDEEPALHNTAIDWIRHQLGLEPIPQQSTPSTTTGKRCASDRIRAMGYRFKYPTFREGYRQLLKEHSRN